jgi:O-antigen ligase
MVFTSATDPDWRRVPFYLAFAAGVAGIVSIAACHILIGLSAAALIVNRRQFRMPPLWLPLAVFIGWTLVSLAVSEDPGAGWPQIKKFYVWVVLFAVFSTFRCVRDVRRLFLAMIGAGAISALWSFVEFYIRYERALERNQPFYQSYVADRITGFMSHWMTFSGHMMICLLLAAAFLLFARQKRPVAVWIAAGAAIGVALLLALTRSVWPATAAGLVYLLWFWRRWVILLMPVAALVLIVAAPEPLATRIRSIYQPDRKLDSNLHRQVLRQTGVRIIEAHPLFGVGAEQVGRNVPRYLPEDAPRPIPREWWYQHLHNTYLHYAAERGIPAALAMIALFVRVLWDLGRALRRTTSPDTKFVLHATLATVIGVLIGGWWEVNLGDSEVLSVLLAVLGGGYAAAMAPTEVADA